MPTTPVTKGTRRPATTPANETVAPKKARAAEEGAAGASEVAASAANSAKVAPVTREGKEEVASPMHPVSLEEFQQFLQCQLKKEAEVHLKKNLPLKDPGAQAIWDDYEVFVKPNLGGTERWVPYHTVLGVHEKFLVEAVHHSDYGWTDYQRFLAIFIFRAHCKCDLFTTAQLPLLLAPGFWEDPKKALEVDGEMEKAMLHYRQTTKKALLTLCFRMIPNRILEDDDANIVRNIILRTQTLLEVAEDIYPVVTNAEMPAAEKFERISERIQKANGLGETWAKMLNVCIDMAYPSMGLLASQCDVGVGALAPLRKLLPMGGPSDHQEALESLRTLFNTAKNTTSGHFWDLLQAEEELAREQFKALPLILGQTNTTRGNLNAGTLQVQLCEYRQFRNSLARSKFDLPNGDESLAEPEKEKRFNPASLLKREYSQNQVSFPLELKDGGAEKEGSTEKESSEEKKFFRVPVESVGGKWKLAERIAFQCVTKMLSGSTEAAMENLRAELIANCQPGAEDVPEDHAAWDHCRVSLTSNFPLCNFSYVPEGSTKRVAFQTTVKASGGVMEAERMGRLCYAKFQAGCGKDEVLAYRNKLYEEGTGTAQPQSGRQQKLMVKPKAQDSLLMKKLCAKKEEPPKSEEPAKEPSKATFAKPLPRSAVTIVQKLRELKQFRLIRIGNPKQPRHSNEVLKCKGKGGKGVASEKKSSKPRQEAANRSIMRSTNCS